MKFFQRMRAFSSWRTVAAFLVFLPAPSLIVAMDFPDSIPSVNQDESSLEFDFPAMMVGVAEYDEGPTGTTVFYFPDGVKGAVDVRGGAPGTTNATAMMNAYEYKMFQAVVFSGGSWYGLSAATGVANGIKELKALEGQVDFVAGVAGAIIYDVGGRRFSRITPDDSLGTTALHSAETGRFLLGARGAGRFAMQGYYYLRGDGVDKYADWPHSGQGGAFRTVGPTKIGVFTVVNALGTIVDRSGRIVRCKRNAGNTECPLISDRLSRFKPIAGDAESKTRGQTENTTLTLVVTNQKMPFWALQRLAIQVHGSMSRAIQPFSTEDDGDVLYAVTTDEVENPSLTPLDLGVLASELAWDAVLSSVPVLPDPPAPLNIKPGLEQVRNYAGTYEFFGGGKLKVSTEEGKLTGAFEGNGRIYFEENRTYELTAAKDGVFIIESPARDVIRFDQLEGVVTGLTLNPGAWSITATILEQVIR